MKLGNPSRSRASSQLDALLDNALDCAIEQGRDDVVEFIVRAIEANVAATNNKAALDSAYLRAVRLMGTRSTHSRVAQAGPARILPGAIRRPRRAN